MKIFFDTNVYVAEALLGAAAEEMIAATDAAGWRTFANAHLLDELQRVLVEELGCSSRFAALSRRRIIRRTAMVEEVASRHQVPKDPKDPPILQAALRAAADYLVTNDKHLLDLDPYEGLRIMSMSDYYQLLITEGLIRPKT